MKLHLKVYAGSRKERRGGEEGKGTNEEKKTYSITNSMYTAQSARSSYFHF